MESVAKRPRQDSDSEGEGEGEPKPVEPLQDVVSGAPMVEVHAHLMEATDTEKKAVQLRAGKSLEERQRQFKEMLLERGVSRAMSAPLRVFSCAPPPSCLCSLPSLLTIHSSPSSPSLHPSHIPPSLPLPPSLPPSFLPSLPPSLPTSLPAFCIPSGISLLHLGEGASQICL